MVLEFACSFLSSLVLVDVYNVVSCGGCGYQCPFHGKIVARDEQGVVVAETHDSSAASAG